MAFIPSYIAWNKSVSARRNSPCLNAALVISFLDVIFSSYSFYFTISIGRGGKGARAPRQIGLDPIISIAFINFCL